MSVQLVSMGESAAASSARRFWSAARSSGVRVLIASSAFSYSETSLASGPKQTFQPAASPNSCARQSSR